MDSSCWQEKIPQSPPKKRSTYLLIKLGSLMIWATVKGHSKRTFKKSINNETNKKVPQKSVLKVTLMCWSAYVFVLMFCCGLCFHYFFALPIVVHSNVHTVSSCNVFCLIMLVQCACDAPRIILRPCSLHRSVHHELSRGHPMYQYFCYIWRFQLQMYNYFVGINQLHLLRFSGLDWLSKAIFSQISQLFSKPLHFGWKDIFYTILFCSN